MKKRTNKLIKMRARDFSIKSLYDLFIKYLTDDCGFFLMRDKKSPYGAIIKIPNLQSGEYGYIGLMYDEIQTDGTNYRYLRTEYNKSSYWKWLKDDNTFKDEVVYPYFFDILKDYGKFEVDDGVITPYTKTTNIPSDDKFPYKFQYSNCKTVHFPIEGERWIVFHTEKFSGEIADNTRISIGHIIYRISNVSVEHIDYIDELTPNNFLGHEHYKITGKLDRAFASVNNGVDDLITFPLDSNGELPFSIGHCEFLCSPAYNSRFVIIRTKVADTQGLIPIGTRIDIDDEIYTVTDVISSTFVPATEIAEETVTMPNNLLGYDYYETVIALDRKYLKKAKSVPKLNIPSKKYLNRNTSVDSYTRVSNNKIITLSEGEVFYNPSNVIFFSMFKQYDDRMAWNELMQNTKRYYDSFGYAGAKLAYSSVAQTPDYRFEPPPYPGMGCPALGFSTDYINNIDSSQTVNIYFSSNGHNASIVVNIADRWEYASVGFFRPLSNDNEYAFPAYVTTSTSGLRPTFYRRKYETMSTAERVFLNMLDFSEKNTSYGHAMPIYQAYNVIGNKQGSYTGTQAMLPNGKWISFGNYKMKRAVINNGSGSSCNCSTKDIDYDSKPTWFNSRNALLTMPIELGHNLNLFREQLPNEFDNQIDHDMHQSILVEPVFFSATQNLTKNNEESFLLGEVPQIYRCTSPIKRYGIYRNKNDEKDLYLIVPNCWEGRSLGIDFISCDFYDRHENWQIELEKQYKEMFKLAAATNMVIHIGYNTNVEHAGSSGDNDEPLLPTEPKSLTITYKLTGLVVQGEKAETINQGENFSIKIIPEDNNDVVGYVDSNIGTIAIADNKSYAIVSGVALDNIIITGVAIKNDGSVPIIWDLDENCIPPDEPLPTVGNQSEWYWGTQKKEGVWLKEGYFLREVNIEGAAKVAPHDSILVSLYPDSVYKIPFHIGFKCEETPVKITMRTEKKKSKILEQKDKALPYITVGNKMSDDFSVPDTWVIVKNNDKFTAIGSPKELGFYQAHRYAMSGPLYIYLGNKHSRIRFPSPFKNTYTLEEETKDYPHIVTKQQTVSGTFVVALIIDIDANGRCNYYAKIAGVPNELLATGNSLELMEYVFNYSGDSNISGSSYKKYNNTKELMSDYNKKDEGLQITTFELSDY